MTFKIIAHRGLLHGPDEKIENVPSQIQKAINMDLDVEVDVWVINNDYFLGHDAPQHKVDELFFNDRMWIHCKNFESIVKFKNSKLNWFWHEKDKMTLTSNGDIWCYPSIFIKNAFVVELGSPRSIPQHIAGICTDYPLLWQEHMETRRD